jgi:hypothetical protein
MDNALMIPVSACAALLVEFAAMVNASMPVATSSVRQI